MYRIQYVVDKLQQAWTDYKPAVAHKPGRIQKQHLQTIRNSRNQRDDLNTL